MDERTVQRVEQWPSRRFSGGYAALHELADGSFSGAVRAAGAWLFMLNGRVIGVFEGRMEQFADADGTVFEAPDAAPVLVFAMLETGGEERGKYYTEDTPLTEVDDMLSGGNFSGYVELSENVLSGDYYVAYYGGKSMSAAFVGASEDLVTGDEAFEAAADEVGIFEVTEVELDVQDVPEPAGDDADASGAASAGAAAGAGATTDDESSTGDSAAESAADDAEPAAPSDASGDATVEDATVEDATVEDVSASSEPTTDAASTGHADAATTESEGDEESASDAAASSGADADAASSTPDGSTSTESSGQPATGPASGTDAASTGRAEDAPPAGERADEASAPGEDVFSEEAEWRETTTVPALDPDESEPPEPAASSVDSAGDGSAGASANRNATAAKRERDAPTGSANRAAGRSDRARERIEQLETAVAERDARIDDLESELASARAERDDLREERDRLEAELESAREKLAAARERAERAGAGGGEHALSPADALAGTNLFVRYDSKGEPTLDAVADGVEADAVNANLRVEHHTQFDASDATVDGEPFESFLQDSLEYEFVSWLVRRLPFEIRDAGHRSGLADLYRVVPEIDRAELDGVVEVETEEGSTSESFDVVCRDKRGRPLVVAELNADREPVSEERMTGLVESATAVADAVGGLGGGFFVTESFFKPDALSAATDASEGGLLSRDKRKSFVKVGRKAGYHLCLVEARGGSFHVSIPEM